MSVPSPKAPAPSGLPVAPSADTPSTPAASQIIPFPQPKTPIDAKSLVVPGATKGGEGGKGAVVSPPFTALTLSNSAFLAEIFDRLPDGARPVVIGKRGDPQQGGWLPTDADRVESACTPDRNTYFNCASLLPDAQGLLTARLENAAAYHVLMLDDVGTKVDRALLGDIIPTWELETSPGNSQIGFKLETPIVDAKEVERFQHRFSSAGLTDKGAMGMVRWARLPNGINGKPKYHVDGQPFQCQLRAWNPTAIYTADQLLEKLAPATEPSSPATPSTVERKPSGPIGNGVYFPPQAENPVISTFKERGLYKREISAGRHDVTCPWLHEHTDQRDTGAAYFEPADMYPNGGFCCQHSHKDEYHIGELLSHFGLTEAQGRGKAIIRVVAGEPNKILNACEQVLALRGNLYQSGGVIVSVGTDTFSGDVKISPLSETSLGLALADASDWEKFDGRKKAWVRCDPVEKNVRILFNAQTYTHLPSLRGLARQPYYRDGGAELVKAAGYDPTSQLLGIFDGTKYELPAPTEGAAREALTLLLDLVSEFHFAKEEDCAAAISAMFTAVTRPALGQAPAFHVTAPSPGSGKSYLCEAITLFAGPGSSAKVSYPRTSEEATKVVLSTLLAAPAVLEFDDMDTDWKPYGAINRMLTSTSITDRILGYSKMATVGTSVLVLGSGNNVGPLKDLARRVLTINLNARSESPATLSYKGNPVATLKGQRERYVTAVLTIIEAWKAAGSPKASVLPIASYGGLWTDFCRHPLIWLGLQDPASTLLEQVRHDPESDILLQMLQEWHKAVGDKSVTVRRLVDENYSTDLHDALMDLPVVEQGKINRSRLGHYLKRNRDRIVGGYMLQDGQSSDRKAWRVVKVEGEAPASPASPPLPEPVAENAIAVSPEDKF